VDTQAVIASQTPVRADGPAESAGPMATSSEVHGAGDAPAPAVVVTPHHRDELLGAAAAAAPSVVPGTPRHRSRRVAGTMSEQVATVEPFVTTVPFRLRAGTVFPQVAPVVLNQHHRS